MFRKLCGILIIVFYIGYMMPAGIACIRNAESEGSIFVVNLFFGWTLIGWIIALVWACANRSKDDAGYITVRIKVESAAHEA